MVRETQYQKILKEMHKNQSKWYLPSDFMKADNFVGYSAGARLSTLLKLGLVEKRSSEKLTVTGAPFIEYKITAKGITIQEAGFTRLPSPYNEK